MATQLPKTVFHTPLTGGALDVCKGLAVYPGHVARAGVAMNHLPFHLLDLAPQLLAWKFHLVVDGGIMAGVCGPAYATSVELEASGNSDDSVLDVVLHDSATVGGVALGLGVTINLSLTIEEYHVATHWVSDGWHSHLEFETYWRRLARNNFQFQIDVVAILLNVLIKKLLGGNGLPLDPKDRPLPLSQALSPVPKLKGLSSIKERLAHIAGDGTATVHPRWSVSVDLAQLAGAAFLGPEFVELVEVLHKYGIVLRFGPRLSYGMPVEIEVSGLDVETGSYDLDLKSKTKDQYGLSHFTATRARDSEVGGGKARLRLHHRVHNEFALDLYAHFQILKLGMFAGVLPKIPLLSFLKVQTSGSEFDHTLDSTVGGGAFGTYSASDGDGAEVCGCEYRVTFATDGP